MRQSVPVGALDLGDHRYFDELRQVHVQDAGLRNGRAFLGLDGTAQPF